MPYLPKSEIFEAAGITPMDSVPDSLWVVFFTRVMRLLADQPLDIAAASPEPFLDEQGNFNQRTLAVLFRLSPNATKDEVKAKIRELNAGFNPNAEKERTLAQSMVMAGMHEEQIRFAQKLGSINPGPGPLGFANEVQTLSAKVADFQKEHGVSFQVAWNAINDVTGVALLNVQIDAHRLKTGCGFDAAYAAVMDGSNLVALAQSSVTQLGIGPARKISDSIR